MYGNWQDETYKIYVAKTNSFSFKWGTFCNLMEKLGKNVEVLYIVLLFSQQKGYIKILLILTELG